MESYFSKPIAKALVAAGYTTYRFGSKATFSPALLGGVSLPVPLVAGGVAAGTAMLSHTFTNWVLPHLGSTDNKMKNRESAAVSLSVAAISEPLAFWILDNNSFNGYPLPELVAVGLIGEVLGNMSIDFFQGEDLGL